jgi:hypothetical protein
LQEVVVAEILEVVVQVALEQQPALQLLPAPLSQSQLVTAVQDHQMTVQEVMVTYQYLDQ